MHILRPMFAWDRDGALEFAAARGFGAVVASGADGPISSHVPFRIHRTSDAVTMQFHLTARNRLAELADGVTPFLLIVWGPDAYVSNDWYATPDHVSTWLYEAVHLSGVAHLRGLDENRGHGDALLAVAEARVPKQPWDLAQMEPDKRESMLAAIRVIDLVVDQIEGQAKLNQHKADADHVAIADYLARSEETGHRRLARKMQALRPGLGYEMP